MKSSIVWAGKVIASTHKHIFWPSFYCIIHERNPSESNMTMTPRVQSEQEITNPIAITVSLPGGLPDLKTWQFYSWLLLVSQSKIDRKPKGKYRKEFPTMVNISPMRLSFLHQEKI